MATLSAPEPTTPDAHAAPSAAGGARTASGDPGIHRWLVATAWSVVAALVVGGITRLTESGLSITVWEPVAGILPPLSHADWARAYQAYLQIPEAQTVHRGITLGGFQVLYWWEWFHRLVARGVGLVIAVPYLWLLARGRFTRAQALRYGILPLLVAAQGALGWYMVSSGLSVRSDVSQYRLVAHLLLALTIFVIAVWDATTLGRALRGATAGREALRSPAPVGVADAGPASSGDHATPGLAIGSALLAALTFGTIASGGFVAGLDGGKVYNEWPLMGGGLVPLEYAQLSPLWRNWFENPVAAQFNHRLLATLTFVLAWSLVAFARTRAFGRPRRALNLAALVVVPQVVLGIGTLLWSVPVPLAALHQLSAVALLAAALVAANESRAARPRDW